jgi:hypothetical protein
VKYQCDISDSGKEWNQILEVGSCFYEHMYFCFMNKRGIIKSNLTFLYVILVTKRLLTLQLFLCAVVGHSVVVKSLMDLFFA